MLTNIEIQNIIPTDILFVVDKVIEIEPGRERWELKCYGERAFFQGHFPGNLICPEFSL